MFKSKMVSFSLAVVMSAALLLTSCTSKPSSQSEAAASDAGNSSKEPVELTVFIDHDWFWMDSFGGRPVDDEITKLTGVKLNIVKAADAQQLPIMIANNELPDIIYTSNLSDLSNDKQCYEMGEFLAKYTPNFKPPMEQIGSAMNEDGKYYYLMNFWQQKGDWEDSHFLPGVGNGGFIYRKDILEQIGNPKMETMDDLMKVLETVKSKYPDMVPLAVGPEGAKYNMFINQSVVQPGVTEEVQQEDGSWKYFATTEEYKSGMKLLNEMANKGLISPNMFTLKYDEYIAEAQQGNVFMWVDDASNAALYNSALEAAGISGAKTEMLQNEFYENPQPIVDTAAGWCGTFVSKTCTNPEAAAKFLEWSASEEAGKLVGWGIEGVHYTEDENGYPVLKPEIAESWNKDYDATVRETGIGCWFFGTRGWFESVRTYDPEANKELTTWLSDLKRNMKIRPECATLKPTAGTEEAITFTKLQALIKSSYPQIIFAKNETEFNKYYDDLQSQIKLQGGEAYDAWANSKWDTIKANYGIK